MEDLKIAYCKIFPSIGIARVGDSEETDGYFIGPEIPGQSDQDMEGFTYRDKDGRIKRQAARFRIYAFESDGNLVQELTAEQAEITWKVSLANKKAAWFRFDGTDKALNVYRGLEKDIPEPRNYGVGTIEIDESRVKPIYVPSKERSDLLEIDGGTKEISKKQEKSQDGEDEKKDYRFVGLFKNKVEVELGELRTDAAGRLIVLGGKGKSTAIDDNGEEIRDKRWIRNYANNNDWYDDTSDGPVMAMVKLKDGQEIEVRDGAWVIIAPPDFAPEVANLVTLYDVMEEVAVNNPSLNNRTTPTLRTPGEVSFVRDIKPILERVSDHRWVSARGLRGHGYHKPGDFRDAKVLDTELAPNAEPALRLQREKIFSLIRKPAYQRGPDTRDDYDNPEIISQATTMFMPPLSGDEGDVELSNPRNWLSLTYLQYERMRVWKEGKTLKEHTSLDEINVYSKPDTVNPHLYTITSLENCVGGAFYPGIEMTSIAREPSLYVEAFRFNHKYLQAGDISKYMALPWQADFFECQVHWWPAQRPDDVITAEDFRKIYSEFTQVGKDEAEIVLFDRIRWDRKVGVRSRPTNEYLVSRLLPEPVEKEMFKNYLKLLTAQKQDTADSRYTRYDPIIPLYIRLTQFDVYNKYVNDPWPAGDSGDRLPSPWRLQYISQEALDAYSGLYFHLKISSPDKSLNDLLKDGTVLDKPHGIQSVDDLRSEWNLLRVTNAPFIAKCLGMYAKSAIEEIFDQVIVLLEDLYSILNKEAEGSGKDLTAADFIEEFQSLNIEELERRNPGNFSTQDAIYKKLRAAEFLSQSTDLLFLSVLRYSGDVDMVDEWRNLGFVRKETSPDKKVMVQVESDRTKYNGLSFRDYFYMLMNIQQYPDFVPYARHLAHEILEDAQKLITDTKIFDENHPESFVEYSKETFTAKLEQIYEILRNQAVTSLGWKIPETREERIKRMLQSAPFNQTDGAWLRYIANAGPTDRVKSLLFEVWDDEVGSGNPALHHGNLFTTLLNTLGHSLPPISTRAYADLPDINEDSYIGAVFQLAISLHSEEFYPEIIGMTLFLEWEVLSLIPRIKGLDHLGIDSHFWQMHVAIDNATNGHGANAKEAVEIYLDNILKQSGTAAMQEEWKRIWKGFVAFATAGYNYFANGDDFAIKAQHPSSPQSRVIELMTAKAHYGSLNHGHRQLGSNRINDLFEEPEKFVKELAHSPWIVPGKPDESRFINYLTTFEGPMYKVFTTEDIALWRKWIEWLGKEGDTLASKRYLDKGEAMLLLLTELREQAIGASGHHMYKIGTAGQANQLAREAKFIYEFFESGNLKEFMRALSDENNGWVVKYNPGASALVVDLTKANRPMGRALDRRFSALNNLIGRQVIIRWIEAGCPMPGEFVSSKEIPVQPYWDKNRLFVQQYGLGAVH